MPVSVSLLAASGALRVASLNLCADEYLLLLARPSEIASLTRLSHDPAESPMWRTARRYPANRGSLEEVIPAHPTLVLAMGGGGRSSQAIARRMGLKVLDLPFPGNLADVERNMIRVASALGDAGRAASWRRRLHRLQPARGRVRDTIFLTGGGFSVSAGSVGTQWMALAGFVQRPLPGGRATLETLALHPPAILLRSTYRQRQHSLGQAWLDHPLASKARSKTIWTDGRPWTCMGPLMLPEIERLRRES
jgi:iron complex transport system substrate-binding protein